VDSEKLRELIGREEGPKLDFKIKLHNIYGSDRERQWDELIKDILSLANGNIGTPKEAGYLVIGAGDSLYADGTRDLCDVGDVKCKELHRQLLDKVNSACGTDNLEIDLEVVSLTDHKTVPPKEKNLLVFSIPASRHLYMLTRWLKLPEKVGKDGKGKEGNSYPPNTYLVRRKDGEKIYVAPPEIVEELRQEKQSLQVEGSTIGRKVRHNLPQPDYGQFIGREQELAKVIGKLRPYPHSTNSVITVDGIGGIGKSALALEIAHRFLRDYDSLPTEERFEAIIWTSAKRTVLRADRGIVNRRQALQTLDDICKVIAITLGMEEPLRSQPEERVELVCRELTRQRTLLIVDNLETVDDEAVMEFLQDLLPAPTKAIVTTRHRIDVAYPVRLRGMPWEDAAILIEQECQKKEVTLSDEQKRKLYERTGGVPLAMVWTIAKIGFGSSVDTVLARLGSRQGDIARFCFEETVERIKGGDAYKLLLALALCKGDASREELAYVAGFGEDEFSRDDGLEELDKLSLVNKKGDKFSMLPLTKEYATHELEVAAYFTAEAAHRLINYHVQHHPFETGGEYLARYKSKLSQSAIEKAFNLIWYKFEEWAVNIGDPYIYGIWVQTVEAVGGKEAIQELKKGFGGFNVYDPSQWGIQDWIHAIERLGEHEVLVEIMRKYPKDAWLKIKCIQVIENSGKKELIQPMRDVLSLQTNEDVAAKLRQAIAKLEQA
jgi:LuxR family glucitol operon transcriptional activator